MAKTVKFNTSAADDKLSVLWNQLEEIKGNLADLIQDSDTDGADEEKLDALTEALDALEDAWDVIGDVLNEA